jgi:hypothetical protein
MTRPYDGEKQALMTGPGENGFLSFPDTIRW